MGVAGGAAIGVAEGVAIAAAGGVASGVAGGVEIGVAGGVAIGVAGGVAIALAGGVESGAAVGVEIGVVGGVAVAGGVVIGVAGGTAAAGTENNSKSLTRIGIDGTGDSVACGCVKLGEIPKAEDRTIMRKIRMAQRSFPCRTGEKNMRGSLGQVSLYNTRASGRKRMKSVCFVLTLVGCVQLLGGPAEMRSAEPDPHEPLQLYEGGWRVNMSTPETKLTE
jgi:hypothetical protein